MTYAYILPIVAGVVLALVGGYGVTTMYNNKSVFKSGVPNYNDEYLRYMEDELNRRSSDSRRTVVGGRRTNRKK